jgi:apolipoprotein N-acyltransferase
VRGTGRLATLARTGLPSLLSGIGVGLSLPPWGFWPLAFPAAALLWWRLGAGRTARHSLRTRLWIGWTAGLGLYGTGLYWATSFNSYGGIVLILLESLALSLACGAGCSGRGRILALPGAMVLTEWIRDIWPFGGLPMGGVALGQAASPLAGAARIGGPLLLTGLVWLAGAGLGSFLAGVWRTFAGPVSAHRFPAGWRRLAKSQSPTLRPSDVSGVVGRSRARLLNQPRLGPLSAGALAILIVVAFAAFGAAAPDGGAPLRVVRVASVQGGGPRGLRKSQVNPATVFNAQLDATNQIAAPMLASGTVGSGAQLGHSTGSDLIVWPEDVVSLGGPLAGTSTERTLAHLARSLHATLLVGVTETATPETFRNEVVAFGPTGAIVGSYEKVHRVPFGEYVPFRGFFKHLANLSAVPQDAIPGHGPGYIDTPSAPVGLMISYEVFFADSGRAATRAGAEILVVPTNTSSYSTSQVPTQEVAEARLQAIAEGRDLVQAAPTGYSAIVNNRGDVLQRTVLGERQVLVADMALRDGSTIYERFGDFPVLLLAFLCLLLGWAFDLTEPSDAERSPGGKAARENWRRLNRDHVGRRPRV